MLSENRGRKGEVVVRVFCQLHVMGWKVACLI